MGQLLSLLQKQTNDISSDIFVDFENCKPNSNESTLYNEIAQQMSKSSEILKIIRSYTGCGESIRKAISAPSKQSEHEAWNTVNPAVELLKNCFSFSSVLENSFEKLIHSFTIENVKQSLESNQATAKLLAELLVFALDFDDCKMTNPSIQNDFSYYRRTLSRIKMSNEDKDMLASAVVKDEMANKMSLFYAYPTPMLKTLIDKLSNMTSNTPGVIQVPISSVTELFTYLVLICNQAVSMNNFAKPDTSFFCLRVMVASIILYDHVHSKGAFSKDSDINIKTNIKLIQQFGGQQSESLMNALRYTTKHLNDESTPKSIRNLVVGVESK